MEQYQKAKRVFEVCSKPLKTCWKFEELDDFDVIYYAPGTECLCCAEEIAKQISYTYKHEVELRTFVFAQTQGRKNVYPDKYCLERLRFSYDFISRLCCPRTIVVCNEDFEEKLIRTIKILGKHIAPKVFCLEDFCVKLLHESGTIRQIYHNRIASKTTICQVSVIGVLASDRNMWFYALQLYLLHKQTYPDKKLKLLLYVDESEEKYDVSASYGFLCFCKRYIDDVVISWDIECLYSINMDSEVLWVVSRHKSYMVTPYSQSFFYIEDEKFEDLLFERGVVGKSRLMNDIYQLAVSHDKSNDICDDVRDFLLSYKPKIYPPWIMKCYYLFLRIKLFGIGCMFCS